MSVSLNGSGAVVPSWRYLGVFPAATSFRPGRVPDSDTWDDDAVRTISDRTWDRHICKIEERVIMLRTCPGSAGLRSRAWKTYMDAGVPYPAQLCLPDASGVMRLNACIKKDNGTREVVPGQIHRGNGHSMGNQRRPQMHRHGCQGDWPCTRHGGLPPARLRYSHTCQTRCAQLL